MNNPIKYFTKKEWLLWSASIVAIVVSNILSGTTDILIFIAACAGITSLILAAKGNVWAHVLMVIFSILYGIISWRFRYWGEMVTYLGMTMPMAIWSAYTWLKNPAKNGREVAIRKLTKRHIFFVILSAILVTIVFYVILKKFDTPFIIFSTISVTTSFLAAALSMLRSSYFALLYAANDIILIVLWIYASTTNLAYISVVVNFSIFLINDLYGFISWKKREKQYD